MNIPMPGETISRDRLIIASCWHVESETETEWALLTLRPEAPYYAVEFWEYSIETDDMHCYSESFYANICDATKYYAELCGAD